MNLVLCQLFIYKYLVYILCRTLADQVDEDQYKDFYYQHHGGAVSYGHQGRGQGSQQYYMTIDQVLYYVNVLSLKFSFFGHQVFASYKERLNSQM